MSQETPPSGAAPGPVFIDLEQEQGQDGGPSPADAPPVPEIEEAPSPGETAAMTRLASVAVRSGSGWSGWFFGLGGALIGVLAFSALWTALENMMARSPILGLAAGALAAAFALLCVILVIREMAAFARLRRIDHVQSAAAKAVAEDDLKGAQNIASKLVTFYGNRAELRWGRDRVKDRLPEIFDADAALNLAEAELLAPLDGAALAEVEAATRQVATITALVPLAFADVLAALTSNLRMIRRISEIYGGRSGSLGTWRLTRAVLAHLVATGAVAVGDDLLSSLGGGHLLGKLSRRFGEGVVNGALTARVGVAAMEVCRPLPFIVRARPSVTGLLKRALAGLFSSKESPDSAQARED
ncbi:MAG: TIGR01620 family protein [Mangrovicoccus sp.]|nr:TIGR01620 family protein [Mangrovicoccus sp.]